ncbi:ATP-dependent DNA helicase RecQ [Sporosarcina sp. Marseille-Q4063]|uniref:RecQ family ATP-dependent DNA helicase n=1 Tax=Sporosarcina sp. Marseille-Q4063 TaxID=2810514 RepID=UPI001BAFF14F|nr:ATP-dependent DNA helicase RecQ [Sporosarcina sp. Marseille-Q4063]QUW22090.1 ATP-dependent DNA helicase RecQ [Sporosarcina sp. Marseille-Q4063]
MDIKSILLKKFGFEQFRAGQEEVIRDVISNRDTIAILPTGSGKSLCYQLPAYTKNGPVLIVSPLVALMEDQVAIMKKNGEKRVVALNSFLAYKDRQRIMTQLALYKFIFVSPEMLMQNNVAEQFKKLSIAFIVIDEAHCISQWGFDFRPDYLRIGEFLQQLDRPNILALTATADSQVLQDIVRYLCLESPAIHKHSLDRNNISYSIKQMNSENEKTDWILERTKNTIGPGIIYVASRRRADDLALQLKVHGISISSYHAGMEQEDRAFIQEQFITGEIDWICATTAFGMGIHKNDVRQVIHENMPSTIAGYMQEVGRAGRDGNLSSATLLFTVEDIGKTRFIVQNDLPTETEVRHYFNLIKEGSSKNDAALLSGISDTGTRIIDYYLERMPIDAAILKLKEQSMEKEKQLQSILQIIKEENCIRKSLLKFYGETLSAPPTSCCSVCGIGEEDWLFEMKRENSTRQLVNWADRLAGLLGS